MIRRPVRQDQLWAATALLLAVLCRAQEPCSSSTPACGAAAEVDESTALLQHLHHSKEEPMRPPLVPREKKVKMTLHVKGDGGLPLCHNSLVGMACEKMNGGKPQATVERRVVQELLRVNSSTMESFWELLGVEPDKTVLPCKELCLLTVDYVAKVGVLPNTSDRACVTDHGKMRCDVDVSPHMVVKSVASSNSIQPDQDVAEDHEEPEEPGPSLIQHLVSLGTDGSLRSGRRQVMRPKRPDPNNQTGKQVDVEHKVSLGADGSALSRQTLKEDQTSKHGDVKPKDEDGPTDFQPDDIGDDDDPADSKEAEAEEDTQDPENCPHNFWGMAELISHFFRIYPAKKNEESRVVQGIRGNATNGTSFISMDEANLDVENCLVQAKAWVSTILLEIPNTRSGKFQMEWFGGAGQLSQLQVQERLKKAFNFVADKLDNMHYVFPADSAKDSSCTSGKVIAFVWKDYESKAYGHYKEATGPVCRGKKDSPLDYHCAIDKKGRYYTYLCQHWATMADSWKISTFIHEAIHHTGPRDVSYDVNSMAGNSQQEQLDNAANYERYATEVAMAAFGCEDQREPALPFQCNPGPCKCPTIAAYCDDPGFGGQVTLACPATCGSCLGKAPTVAPAVVPTAGSMTEAAVLDMPGACSQDTGIVSIFIDDMEYSAECSDFAGYCSYAESVRQTCPITCNQCAQSEACRDDPAYSTDIGSGALSCADWSNYASCWPEAMAACPIACRVPACMP